MCFQRVGTPCRRDDNDGQREVQESGRLADHGGWESRRAQGYFARCHYICYSIMQQRWYEYRLVTGVVEESVEARPKRAERTKREYSCPMLVPSGHAGF